MRWRTVATSHEQSCIAAAIEKLLFEANGLFRHGGATVTSRGAATFNAAAVQCMS